MKTIRSDFSFKGRWPVPGIAALQAFVRAEVTRFLAADAVTARIVRGGAIQQDLQLDLAEEWAAAMTPEVTSVSVGAYAAARSFSIYWTLPAQINVSAGGDDPDAAVALVELARAALGLEAEGKPTQVARCSLSINGASPRAADLAWLDEAVAVLRGFNDAPVTAGFRLATSPAILRTADLSVLRDHVQAGAAVLEWNLNCGDAHLSYGQSGHIVLGASHPSDQPLLALDAEARRRLGLIATAAALDDQTQGVSRRGFMRRHPDPEWFDGLVTELRRIVGGGGNVTGRVRTLQDEEMTFRSVDLWRQALASGWAGVAQAGLWCAGANGSVNVNVDLRRELVTSQFNLRSGVAVEAMAEQFNTACELDAAPEGAYRYRKYGRSYRIKEWLGNKGYGEAIVEAVRLAFDGMPVVVTNAFVEAGEPTASLEPFQTVAAFAAWFATERPFHNASLTVEGFQGRHLGIHVDRRGESFRILGSLNGTLFNKVDETFEAAFVRTDKKDTGEKVAKASGEFGKTFVTAVVALLVAVTGAAWNFVNASREAPELKIVYPPDKAELKASAVDVRWSYREPRVFGRPRWSADRAATVSVLGEDKPARSVADGRGHALIGNLDPGSYTVIVSVPDGPTESRQVTVKPVSPAPGASSLKPP